VIPAHHERLRKDLDSLKDLATRTDRVTGELLMRVVGVTELLHKQHTVDRRGRCERCRPPRSRCRRWLRRRRPCQVYDALTTYRLHERHPASALPGGED
jgi:hypothetical protein